MGFEHPPNVHCNSNLAHLSIFSRQKYSFIDEDDILSRNIKLGRHYACD
jgi:hypothetical protein